MASDLKAKDPAHVVEIPTISESQPFISHHPLAEISASPGHLLLLKLLHREETDHGRRAAVLEGRAAALRLDAFWLSCLFLAFHFISLTLLFVSSIDPEHVRGTCGKWWVPSSVSLATSLVIVCSVQIRVFDYWKMERGLGKERSDGRALTRRILELRMKGSSYDLWKETAGPVAGTAVSGVKRMKSSSVELKWTGPVKWCTRNLVTICLLCFTGIFFPACKLILCG